MEATEWQVKELTTEAKYRLAYRTMIWAHTCPFAGRNAAEKIVNCRKGFPGCGCSEWIYCFGLLGWLQIEAEDGWYY